MVKFNKVVKNNCDGFMRPIYIGIRDSTCKEGGIRFYNR